MTTDEELIERMARSLFADHWLDDLDLIPCDWGDACDIEHEAWRDTARAILPLIREAELRGVKAGIAAAAEIAAEYQPYGMNAADEIAGIDPAAVL